MPQEHKENRGMVIEGQSRRNVPVPVHGESPQADGERSMAERDSQPIPRKRRRRRPPPPPPQRGCMGTCALFGGLSLLVMTLVLAFMAVTATVGIAGFLSDPLDNFLGIFGFDDDAVPVVVDSRTVVLGIREMALLQTASGDIQVTKTVIDTAPAPDAELRVSYVGYVTVGIDLSRITDEALTIEPDGSMVIVLPPAQLTGCYLSKPDTLHRSCTDIPLVQDCGKIINKMHEEAYDRAVDELRETAFELGLLELAYQEAETRIFDLLTTLGYDVSIGFQRSIEEPVHSETCFP